MTINKNTVTLSAEEYITYAARVSRLLSAYVHIINSLVDEEALRQKHRSYLEARCKIFDDIDASKYIIQEAHDWLDKADKICFALVENACDGCPNNESEDKPEKKSADLSPENEAISKVVDILLGAAEKLLDAVGIGDDSE